MNNCEFVSGVTTHGQLDHYEFVSGVTTRGQFNGHWSDTDVKNEPMLFNASLSYAYERGGPLTRAFLQNLPTVWSDASEEIVVDSRVHMLMPGWYPCIPGWHHDDVPRSTPNGQPNYRTPEYRSVHLMGLVHGDICPTEFAVGNMSLPLVETDIYATWHPFVEKYIEQGQVSRYKAPSGMYIEFDADAMHRGTSAVLSGWRWFIRLSRFTDRIHRITNEQRQQVQVYLPAVNAGW
jgi:hypothetical protein